MSDWTDGYMAAVRDVAALAAMRKIVTPELHALFEDMRQDALVIEHEQGNRLVKRRLSAAREAERRVKQASLL